MKPTSLWAYLTAPVIWVMWRTISLRIGPALDERRRAVIALLALGREERLGAVAEEEELELAEGLQLESRRLPEVGLGPGQDVVGGEGRGRAVAGQVAADEIQAAVVEGIEERRPEDGHDVEVGQGRVDHALEQRRSVDPLALGQDGIGLGGGRPPGSSAP